MPEAWAEPPAKRLQKDVDAPWTQKNAESHYGYKNHLKADAESKLIERDAVTDASVHDSQKLAEWAATTDGAVYAGSPESSRGNAPAATALRATGRKKATARSPSFGRALNTSSAS